ncbi:cyclase [Candidatus Pacearchaeota archaeon CG10_big_fil_rev_8_21_14_0_10_31_24]|nr:MAG: cyclase [Candidatus Pacearchaeota archaeon CG10_big_fil_rev_8_21_14_0_10_31_24]
MKIIDISIPVSKKTPLWPGTSRIVLKKFRSLKRGDNSNDTEIEMSMHAGTHIDAPLHFIRKGASIDQLPLKTFMGSVFVAYLPKVKEINAEVLKKLNLPKKVERILFKTSNSLLWKNGILKFKKDYVGLTKDATLWLSRRGVKLVGVDYLSVAKFNEIVSVHKILLKNKVILLEGIDLSGVSPGTYHLICLPLKISKAEAAPVRAILIK